MVCYYHIIRFKFRPISSNISDYLLTVYDPQIAAVLNMYFAWMHSGWCLRSRGHLCNNWWRNCILLARIHNGNPNCRGSSLLMITFHLTKKFFYQSVYGTLSCVIWKLPRAWKHHWIERNSCNTCKHRKTIVTCIASIFYQKNHHR